MSATGWMVLEEAHAKFRSVDEQTFSAEFLCLRASTKGLICPNFSRIRHGLHGFQPDPAIGPTYMSVDFGGTNPSATVYVTFISVLDGVECVGQAGDTKVVPFGSYIFHSEHYKAEREARAKVYTDRLKQIEAGWRNILPEFRIWERYYDSQSKGMRGEWSDHGFELRSYAPKRAQEQALKVAELIDDDLFYVDSSAPMLMQEIESWRWDERKGIPMKDSTTQDHSVDAAKYAIANIRMRLVPARDFGKPQERVVHAPQTAASAHRYRTAGVGSPHVFGPQTEHYDPALAADYEAVYGAMGRSR